jgi:DNA-binding response OmpR family regulator
VFLTDRNDAIAKNAGSFLGDDFINKPFKIPELKIRIERLLHQ